MTMPRGRVMADSRKEPTVKARFSLSSWSLQMGQLFISRNSSSPPGAAGEEELETLRLEMFSIKKERNSVNHLLMVLMRRPHQDHQLVQHLTPPE